MSIIEDFETFKYYMVNNFDAKLASGGKEIIKRCHICGDSKNSSTRHMYIGLKDNVIVYNCFKCGAKGIVDSRFLKDMGCYDQEIIATCTKNINSKYSKRYVERGNNSYNVRNLIIPNSNNEFAIKKLNYISRRLGNDLSINDVSRFKIILNLLDFLSANNINYYTRNIEVMKILNNFFLGFLSVDNGYVILRRMVPENKLPSYIDLRYVNYNIFSNTNSVKYYVIPNSINLNYPLEIHIAEGVFDILSIYTNLHKNNNAIYAAICGKSYKEIIEYFILNFGFMGFNLHIYADSDIDSSVIKRIADSMKIFNITTYMHRNVFNGEKDFGVKKELISDYVVKF